MSLHLLLSNASIISLERHQSAAINLSIKRDDETDTLAAGNKIRKLSFLLADAVAKVILRVSSSFLLHLLIAATRFKNEICNPVAAVVTSDSITEPAILIML